MPAIGTVASRIFEPVADQRLVVGWQWYDSEAREQLVGL
jgi:hypothetical protein